MKRQNVFFDYSIIAESGKIDRNGAAQLEFIVVEQDQPIIINNALNFSFSTPLALFGYKEDVKAGEYSKTEYDIRFVGAGTSKMMLVRKYYED